MELQVMGGIFGGSSDARVGAADQGGDIGELDGSGRALGFRDENASDEAAAEGDMVAGETGAVQGTSGDGDGVGGDTAATRGMLAEMEWAKMSKSQRNRWLRRNKK